MKWPVTLHCVSSSRLFVKGMLTFFRPKANAASGLVKVSWTEK